MIFFFNHQRRGLLPKLKKKVNNQSVSCCIKNSLRSYKCRWLLPKDLHDKGSGGILQGAYGLGKVIPEQVTTVSQRCSQASLMATFSERRIGGSLMHSAKDQCLLPQKLRLSQKLMPHGFPQHGSKKPFSVALSLVGERRDLAITSHLSFLPLPALFGKPEFITLKKAKVHTIFQTDLSTIFSPPTPHQISPLPL